MLQLYFEKNVKKYHEISDLKLKWHDKEHVRQPNAQRIPKPSVLGKPTPFSNSPEMRSFQTNKSVNKTNASDGLFKPVTQQNLPQKRNQAVRNTNVLKPGMFRIASTTTQTRTPQLPHASRNTNPHMSKSSGSKFSLILYRDHSLSAIKLKIRLYKTLLFLLSSGCTNNMTGNLKLEARNLKQDTPCLFQEEGSLNNNSLLRKHLNRNGVVLLSKERKRTLVEDARTMLFSCYASIFFLG
ncbi:hypothetical protein Tco_0833367 [Tanacetum coccineum]